MALCVEKSFVVSDDQTGERVVLTQLENGNFSIKVNSATGELKPDTFEELGRAIQEMTV
jgi:hypothetical protein